VFALCLQADKLFARVGLSRAYLSGLTAVFLGLSPISFDVRAQPRRIHCHLGAPTCPVSVQLRPGARPVVVQGRLSRTRSSVSYRFVASPNVALEWKYHGPAARILLQDPIGNTDGPGIPERVVLRRGGRYIFSISANTMAENIFGPFRLSLKLVPADG
jgi:hypothetical protein